MNVLFITLDQFRADSLGCAGHPLVRTPNLDRLAREGVRLARHYSQAAPCSPGRAALYTGTYQSNNRVTYNGTPLPNTFDNVAKMARRAGFDPTLFGYTDQAVDPWSVDSWSDPRLDDYSGVLDGFTVGYQLPDDQGPWVAFLRELGYEVPDNGIDALRDEASRPVEHSLATFLTDRFLEWLNRQDRDWFVHLSYLRPHPPYNAAGQYASLYDPADVPMPIAAVPYDERHVLHQGASKSPGSAAPADEEGLREMRAQYYGMISEVDAQLGRVFAAIEARGEWDDTIVIVTADHGDQLGDHGLKEKLGYFPQSYAILGLWRDPRFPARSGRVVEQFTENVDVMPTLADALGVDVPLQCDGYSLTPLLDGLDVPWRLNAHYEWDYRALLLRFVTAYWPVDRSLARCNVTTTVNEQWAFVHFGDGSALLFDLVRDPTWRTTSNDPSLLYTAASTQLQWRQEHLRRETSEFLIAPDRPGRWPDLPTLRH